jgi:hypothetical protein
MIRESRPRHARKMAEQCHTCDRCKEEKAQEAEHGLHADACSSASQSHQRASRGCHKRRTLSLGQAQKAVRALNNGRVTAGFCCPPFFEVVAKRFLA